MLPLEIAWPLFIIQGMLRRAANDTLRNCFSQRRKGNFTQRIHKKRIPGAFAPYVLFA